MTIKFAMALNNHMFEAHFSRRRSSQIFVGTVLLCFSIFLSRFTNATLFRKLHRELLFDDSCFPDDSFLHSPHRMVAKRTDHMELGTHVLPLSCKMHAIFVEHYSPPSRALITASLLNKESH